MINLLLYITFHIREQRFPHINWSNGMAVLQRRNGTNLQFTDLFDGSQNHNYCLKVTMQTLNLVTFTFCHLPFLYTLGPVSIMVLTSQGRPNFFSRNKFYSILKSMK